MFELLFKYSEETFARSELIFASGWPVWLLVVLCVAAAAVVGTVIARRHAGLPFGKAATIGALQWAMLALLFVLAWRPALVTQTLRPQENSIALLLDTSGSMARADDRTSGSRLQLAIEGLTEKALPGLDKFDLRLHSFAGEALELPSLERVPAPGPVTHIGDALRDVLRGAGTGAVAAVVLVSDGADNSGTLDAARIAEIASFGVPVHTVGVGAETIPNDLELDDVQLAPVGLAGSTISAQLSIRHSGRVRTQLKVYDGDAIIAAETLDLPERAGIATRWIDIDVGEPGIRNLKFALDPLPNEPNLLNNEQFRPIEVPSERRHVLYLEGEPRWDYKFIRRALHEHDALRLPSLIKTTPNKNYRQGLEIAEELEDGPPTDAETLFAYDALIIGSFEAQAFTEEQHALIRDFVGKRGGSLLMLGGRRGLADGGWGNTVVADVLPVELPVLNGPSFYRVDAKAWIKPRENDPGASLTRASPITRFESEDRANDQAWAEMPPLENIQLVGEPKPAAEILLWGQVVGKPEPPDPATIQAIETLFGDDLHPLLIHQRYGAGNAYVLATGGTWRWQMQLPHDDLRSETFWRQLTQAMATAAPRKVMLSADKTFYGDEIEVKLRAEIRDKAFDPTSEAAVEYSVIDGRGLEQHKLPMTPVVGEPGVYEATYETPRPGLYRFTATASIDGEELGTGRFAVRREDGIIENFRVQQNRPLLERIAAATGGRYFALADVGGLPEAVSFSEAGIVERQVLDLWNMPAFFLLLLLLKCGEWLVRLFWGRL